MVIETLKLKDLDLSNYNHSIDMKKLYVDLPEYGSIAVPPSTDTSLVNTVYTFEANKDGVISGIKFDSGDTVVKGDILFTIE